MKNRVFVLVEKVLAEQRGRRRAAGMRPRIVRAKRRFSKLHHRDLKNVNVVEQNRITASLDQ
ncbi:hypothetical protein Pla22_43740 [Rubripirellula amarantea]|uniref:Uncharacterized protein n=1 Tax=Rubripirellula amarantea TaxID=2527999 RepID=A0A5C5WHB3_9BACT|nr:hypothetical protein [Rubripirellula amarantea]TWT49182.1 hypothetical protein Pla22_43740 [Rubripirellula amarantea]